MSETIAVTPTDRFLEAVEEWAEARMMEREEALETKAEQALLEIEHLVAEAHEVAFSIEGDTIRYEPSNGVYRFLLERAEEADIDVETVTTLYINLYANAYLDSDTMRPSNAPPTE